MLSVCEYSPRILARRRRTGRPASGRTRSASAATSPPSPAATRSPSVSSAGQGNAPQARIAEANRAGTRIDLRQLKVELLSDEADEADVVIRFWVYAGSGWANEGETALAVAAAARAREYAQERAQARRDRKATTQE